MLQWYSSITVILGASSFVTRLTLCAFWFSSFLADTFQCWLLPLLQNCSGFWVVWFLWLSNPLPCNPVFGVLCLVASDYFELVLSVTKRQKIKLMGVKWYSNSYTGLWRFIMNMGTLYDKHTNKIVSVLVFVVWGPTASISCYLWIFGNTCAVLPPRFTPQEVEYHQATNQVHFSSTNNGNNNPSSIACKQFPTNKPMTLQSNPPNCE